MGKLKILVLNQYYLPGYKSGGPIRTIENMVNYLSDHFDFFIFTSDRDALDIKSYEDVRIDKWNSVGTAKVYYASPKMRCAKGIRKIFKENKYDILYLNSFFNPIFTITPLLLFFFRLISVNKIIVAPRGEFSKGALLLKRWKKKLFIYFSKISGLYSNVFWQASSDFEKKDIKSVFPNAFVHVASDLPCSKNIQIKISRVDTEFKVLFLSRISPMKNLDYALRVFQKVKADVVFYIYGPVRDAKYWDLCQNLFSKLPDNVKVFYCDTVEHDQVQSIMAQHDLFFLPTLGENFGHVIAESLSAGTPVLIADTTPWRNLEADRLGWDLPLSDPELFAAKIDFCAKCSLDERQHWRDHIQEAAKGRLLTPELLDANRQLFLQAFNNKL
jgi:glycosyltransferase involved in cell wall biosynthesis